jgi:hypothetical protein
VKEKWLLDRFKEIEKLEKEKLISLDEAREFRSTVFSIHLEITLADKAEINETMKSVISQYIKPPYPPLMTTKTVLFLAANPQQTARLRLDEELREIDESLRRANKREQFKLEPKGAVRWRDLYRSILDCNPQIVHFSGHGGGTEGIVLEDEKGHPSFVDGIQLAAWFEVLAGEGVECVVLNACYSKEQAEAICQHVPYTIGMSRSITDEAAIDFAVGFYDALGSGKDIEFAFKLGCSQLVRFREHGIPILLKKGMPV